MTKFDQVSLTRSANMRAIKSINTKPELLVRRLVHSLGYRYRLYRKDLPGKPDMVFPGKRAVIFIHGCFWHQHDKRDCSDAQLPKTNTSYWTPKLKRNCERDLEHEKALANLGWRVLKIWDCETKSEKALTKTIKRFLS